MQHTFIADSLYAVSYTSGPSLYLVLQDFFQAPSPDRSLTVTTSPAGCIYSGCLVFRSIGYRRSNFFKVTIVQWQWKHINYIIMIKGNHTRSKRSFCRFDVYLFHFFYLHWVLLAPSNLIHKYLLASLLPALPPSPPPPTPLCQSLIRQCLHQSMHESCKRFYFGFFAAGTAKRIPCILRVPFRRFITRGVYAPEYPWFMRCIRRLQSVITRAHLIILTKITRIRWWWIGDGFSKQKAASIDVLKSKQQLQNWQKISLWFKQRWREDKISGFLYVPMWQKNLVAVCIN